MIYKLVPIAGMESVQKNFAYLQCYDKKVAANLANKPFVTLHERFQLLERGFQLQYEGPRTSGDLNLSCEITFGSGDAK
ncbi:hypothetical protein M3Y99_00206600 [Aphelenchoides fujianensis]|nr:hypothetical protein M3Y99_00206600 [Aphelenchoides fujianensis]